MVESNYFNRREHVYLNLEDCVNQRNTHKGCKKGLLKLKCINMQESELYKFSLKMWHSVSRHWLCAYSPDNKKIIMQKMAAMMILMIAMQLGPRCHTRMTEVFYPAQTFNQQPLACIVWALLTELHIWHKSHVLQQNGQFQFTRQDSFICSCKTECSSRCMATSYLE